MDLLENEPAGRTLLRGQGHGDFDPLARPRRRGVGVRARFNAINQAQIDEVQLHFRIEAVAQRGDDVGLGKHLLRQLFV